MSIDLIIGDDPVLISQLVSDRIDALIGDGDRSLMLEILTDAAYLDDNGSFDATRLVTAGATPPFLTDRRVVVGRAVSRFSSKSLYQPLVALVESILDTTDLLLVWEKLNNPQTGRPETTSFPKLPKPLKAAIEAAGGTVTDTRLSRKRADLTAWLRAQLSASELKFDGDAIAAVEHHLGEDRSGVVGLLRTLEGALGHGAAVTVDDITNYGGSMGSVAPWDLDDAIDRGDLSAALAVVHRLIPLTATVTDRSSAAFRLIATLQNRYSRMLRLEGSGVRNESDAASILGMKGSTFPAKKVLVQSRSLGLDGISKSIKLIAKADLDLRGMTAWPPELVIEVLVARLANISRRR